MKHSAPKQTHTLAQSHTHKPQFSFMDLSRKVSILVFVACILITLQNQQAVKDLPSVLKDPHLVRRNLGEDHHGGLTYDYYGELCPSAETIISSTVRELYASNISVAPALIRLVFHDCFIMGCDASIMLDSDSKIKSEKEAIPNLTLKGFGEIDIIKSRLEEACHGIVSCADTLALAARESTGDQFYPVLTGRKDSVEAFQLTARQEIPRPDFVFHEAIRSFASRGFSARELVALLGAHSTGQIHCEFIRNRLFKFQQTNRPNPSIDADFLKVLRSECSHQLPTENNSSTASFENRGIRMDYEGPRKGFGEVYYRSLLQGRGLLIADQQLTKGQETKSWVETYASDALRFRRDFGQAMFKLSHLQVPKKCEVRLNCRKVN